MKSGGQVAPAVLLAGEPQIARAFDAKPAQQGPKKQDRAEHEGAMKERLEIEGGERGKNSMRRQPLCGPKKTGSGEGAEKNRGGEIPEQSGCVFQEANVRFPPDAESTHMEGEGRRRPETRSPRDQIRRRLAFPGEIHG